MTTTRFVGILGRGVAALLVLWLGAGLVYAHAVVIDSSPKDGESLIRSPGEIVLHFNAKIERSLARLSLAAHDGRVIPLPALKTEPGDEGAPDRLVVPLPRLEPGDYTLRYKVLSTDGHATPGVLRFSVKDGT